MAAPPGVTRHEGGYRAKIYAPGAKALTVSLYAPEGRATSHVALSRLGDGWWGARFSAPSGSAYGLRADGVYRPGEGLFYNPAKLLMDPYAHRLVGKLAYGDATRLHAPFDYWRPSEQDSEGSVPLALLPGDGPPEHPPRRLHPTPWEESLIYEVHVKAATQRMEAVPEELRGRYLGLAHPAFTSHLRRLGVTAVELLPVLHFADNERLLGAGLVNYWGYATVSFFAIEPRYASRPDCDVAAAEFAEMVDALHAAGIEVILDVVLNHTGEGDISGPTFSYRGLAATEYYLMEPEGPFHVDLTGTGNTMNFSSPVTVALATDALRFLAERFSVDGFRFDLATSLGRSDFGVIGYPFQPDGGALGVIRNDPLLSRLKLIAEPWDLGPAGYQVGRYPPPWAEWNDQVRDAIRRSFSPGARHGSHLLAEVLCEQERPPASRSINFVTCHDGFTLADLVSYGLKRNWENGEENRDGSDDNLSWPWGPDGPSADPKVNAMRERARRAMITTLLMSPGIPMLLGGDELGRSQGGNNNAYCQDRLEYALPFDSYDQGFLEYVAALSELRRSVAGPYLSFGRLETPAREDGHLLGGWWLQGEKGRALIVIFNLAEDQCEVDPEATWGIEGLLIRASSEPARQPEAAIGSLEGGRLSLAPFSVLVAEADFPNGRAAML